MDMFHLALLMSALLCSLVAGFLFAYAVVIMPGIKHLNDRDFLRAFQITDRVIQNNQPLFILVWLGSAIALVAAMALGFGRLTGVELYLLFCAGAAYVLGVQVPTVVLHLPLNNRLQTLDLTAMDESELQVARTAFEPRWNRSNVSRTLIAVVVSAALMVLLWRL